MFFVGREMYFLYQASKTKRNKRYEALGAIAPKLACLAVLSLSISACTVSSKVDSLVEADTLVTGSVAKPTKPEGVDGTDAEVIKSVVVDAGNMRAETSELAWSNPDTGNKGTIVAIDKFVGSHGQNCKKFQTTVDSFVGISLYDGETCEVKRGMWVLSWFMRR